MKISITDTDVFKTLLEYTKALVEILAEYELSEENRKKLNDISDGLFTLEKEDE